MIKPNQQIQIGQFVTLFAIFAILIILNHGIMPLHIYPAYMAVAIALLGSYAFFISCKLISPGLTILSLITVNMIAITFGIPEMVVLALVTIVLLYQGIIGIYRIKSKQINIRQKVTIWSWLIISIIMGFYPPWTVIQSDDSHITRYGLLWSPPGPDFPIMDGVGLDINRIFLQWFLLSLAGCILIQVLKDKSMKINEEPIDKKQY